MIQNMSGIDTGELLGKRGKRSGLMKKFMSMSPAAKRAAFNRLPAWKKVLFAAAAPAVFPFIPPPSPHAILLAKAKKAAIMHGEDPELMGGKIRNWIIKQKKLTPAQRKANFKKLPWWKKALFVAAAPALAATAVASLPLLLPTAAAIATTAAAAKLTKKATLALAKRVKEVRAARASGLAQKVSAAAVTASSPAEVLTVPASDIAEAAAVPSGSASDASGSPWPSSAF